MLTYLFAASWALIGAALRIVGGSDKSTLPTPLNYVAKARAPLYFLAGVGAAFVGGAGWWSIWLGLCAVTSLRWLFEIPWFGGKSIKFIFGPNTEPNKIFIPVVVRYTALAGLTVAPYLIFGGGSDKGAFIYVSAAMLAGLSWPALVTWFNKGIIAEGITGAVIIGGLVLL